jgi:hypothetical protein
MTGRRRLARRLKLGRRIGRFAPRVLVGPFRIRNMTLGPSRTRRAMIPRTFKLSLHGMALPRGRYHSLRYIKAQEMDTIATLPDDQPASYYGSDNVSRGEIGLFNILLHTNAPPASSFRSLSRSFILSVMLLPVVLNVSNGVRITHLRRGILIFLHSYRQRTVQG